MKTPNEWVNDKLLNYQEGIAVVSDLDIAVIQLDAQQDLITQMAVMVEALKTHGRHINGCPFIANRFIQNEIECTCGYNDLLSNAPLAAKKLLE